MKTFVPFRSTLNYLLPVIVYLLLSIGVKAQTYTTVADGAWSSAATWQGGTIPNATNIPATAVINIKNIVTYTSGNISNSGTINIYNPAGLSPRLVVAGGVSLTNNLLGKIYITGGEYRQYRFTGGGQSGTSQTGNFTNNGGYIQIKSSYVEVAGNWTNQTAGTVVFKNSSLAIGQSYQTNALSIDTLSYTSVSIGWQGSGNFTEGGLNVYFQSFRAEVASATGNFTINSNLIANGTIDYITLKNDFTGISGSGNIDFQSNLVTSGLSLQAYCVSNSGGGHYNAHGSQISGPQIISCSLNYFPATLVGAIAPARMNFSANPVLISGTALQVGAKYKYEGIAPGIDAIVNIDSLVGGATINMLDDNSSGQGFIEGFQPQITSGTATGKSYAVFTFNYKIAGTSADDKVDTVKVTALDIDGTSSLKEIDQISLGAGATANYIAATPAISMTQLSPGTFSAINTDGNTVSGIDTSSLEYMFTVKNTNVSSFTVKLGMSNTQATSELRLFSIYMKDFVYSNYQALPLKMESFTATLSSNGKNADLRWTTANEINVSHFVIEKSTDGKNFSDAGLVFAYGNTTQNSDYSFSDDISTSDASVIYYRLRLEDVDGKSQYSDIRIIRISKQSENNITILTYPNPVSNELQVTIPANWQNKKVVYELFNSNGQVLTKTEAASSGQTATLSVSNLSRGFYLVRVTCGDQTALQKIIKN